MHIYILYNRIYKYTPIIYFYINNTEQQYDSNSQTVIENVGLNT